MRRSERTLEESDIQEILKHGEYGVLATIGENNYPYAVPLNYVYFNNSIYFHCAFEGNKLQNIKFNDRVSFCIVGNTEIIPGKFTTKYKSVIIFGHAFIINSEKVKKDILNALVDKYSTSFKKEGMEYIDRAVSKTNVIKMSIDHVTGKGRII
ncbi:pyridoxamine 5'-phosphate oxidase family protein [Clostridium sp. LBM24168]